MPLHLQSIKDDDQIPRHMTDLLMICRQDPDEFFMAEDKYIHTRFALTDELTGDPFGKLVFTMKNDDEQKHIEIIDVDITLDNEKRTAVHILALRAGSSDANEYYDAMTEDDEAHFELETVSRHIIREPLENTVRNVSISAFPFQATIYEDIEAFNRWAGFGKEINVKGLDYKVHGYSERFIMPGGTFSSKKEDDETYTFLLGTVKSWKEVRWSLGEDTLDFIIVRLDTALGVIPAAMGREVFDLSLLKEGAIIAMNADIKAELAKPEDYIAIHSGQ